MNPHNPPRKLHADDVDWSIDPASFGFATTGELEPLDSIVGQPRALRALDFGLGMPHTGYNVYVAGASGMGKMGLIRSTLEKRVGGAPTPHDWIYVNNFAEPDHPIAIPLEPGEAARFKEEIDDLVDRLKADLPKAFQHKALRREKEKLTQEFQDQDEKLLGLIETAAAKHEMSLHLTPTGFVIVPLIKGEPLSQEDVAKLSNEEQKKLDRRQKAVATKIRDVMARRRELGGMLRARMREIDRKVATEVIEPLVDEIAAHYKCKKLSAWLGDLKKDLIDNWQAFQNPEGSGSESAIVLLGNAQQPAESSFRKYEINVVVDNSGVEGAPVIIEHSPNYKNLFGVIERSVDRLGRETTDFTHIKAGSLLRACGGYLVLELADAIIEPVVWKELKRSIKRGSLQIEAYDPFGMFSMTALKPDPIPLDVKLVVVGDPLIYHLLQLLDEDFAEIFKVKAEFDPHMRHDEEAGQHVGRLLSKLAAEEDWLLSFTAEAVSEILRAGTRLAADKEKLTAEFGRLADLAREACYWARQSEADTVNADHVRQASRESIYRRDLVASKMRDWIDNGVLQIALDGTAVGQVNGLAVADLGDYAFGWPQRVSASVGVGAAGIINIERESKLSGRTYDKGMLILEGYLRHKFAGHQPLALSASLAMEQSYGMIDGDSASAAELITLLSALAEIPLRQEVAITGSVNQRGEIQAVGGVIQKIEGFFDVCQQCGLTGKQGVVIPASNLRHAILRPDVVKAVREERFHLWTVEHVDQALELLGERPAGDIDQEGTIHYAVAKRLQSLAGILKSEAPAGTQTALSAQPSGREPPVSDPRPTGPHGEPNV